jgi:type IV secretory pathway protease TraF
VHPRIRASSGEAMKIGRARQISRWPLYLGATIMLLVTSPTLFGFRPPLLWQLTPSEPRGLYLLWPLPDVLRPGMLVTLPVPPAVAELVFEHGWLPRSWHGAEVLLVKPVAAVAGDDLCLYDDGVWINDIFRAPIYRALGGVTLPVIRGCWMLKDDELFVMSTSVPNSFDGRYFLFIHRSQLRSMAVPLWIWED